MQGLTYHRGTCRVLKDGIISSLQRRQLLRSATSPVLQPMQEDQGGFELKLWKRRKVEDSCNISNTVSYIVCLIIIQFINNALIDT